MKKHLRNCSLFSDLEDTELEKLSGYFSSRDIEKDQIVYEFSEKGSDLFIVAEGRISSSIILQSGRERIIEEYSPGDFFGETSLFEKLPRSTTCRALHASRLLSIDENRFIGLIEEDSQLAIKIMLKMLSLTTIRLRDTSRFLADIVQWGEKERKRTIRDELTGLYNMRYFNDAFLKLFNMAKNSKTPLSVIMADLDSFRDINELLKEEGADRLLRQVASIIKNNLRNIDIIARYGGDEFIILLPETNRSEAKSIAEEIREKIGDTDFSKDSNKPVKITLSQGVASFPEDAKDLESLKEKADSAMYRAKELGKNRIESAE